MSVKEHEASRQTHGALLRERATRLRDKTFIVLDDQQCSFGSLYEESCLLAKAIIAEGVRPREHIGVLMPNSLDALRIFFAAHMAGVVVVPINARFKRRELQHVIGHADIRFLFTTQAAKEHLDFVTLLWDTFRELGAVTTNNSLCVADAPHLRRIVIASGEAPSPAITIEKFIQAGAAVTNETLDARIDTVASSDVAYLLYTSGTTASPKGCELSHQSVLDAWTSYAELISLEGEEGIWSPCPFFHIGGLGPLASALVKESVFLSMSYFNPEAAVRQLERYRPAHLFPAFPPLTLGVLRSELYRKERFSFLKTVLNVSPPETQMLIQDMLPQGVALLNDFGMTEASGIVAMTRPGDPPELRIGSNGRPLPGVTIKILEPGAREPRAPGESGEICFQGGNVFRAYYKDAAATASALDEQGWVHSGDLGYMDADGYLHFVGRLKDILKVGGENVAPAEVESYLSTHSSVKMAQVIGRADEKYGEVAVAFVEVMPDAVVTSEELIKFCVGHLASYKIPREIRFVTEWPMSATKIQKFRLKELL